MIDDMGIFLHCYLGFDQNININMIYVIFVWNVRFYEAVANKGLWGFPAKNVMKLVVTVTGWGVNPRYIFFYVFQFIPGHVAKNVQHLHLDPHCWNKSSWYIRRFFSPEGESEFPRKDGSTQILKALQNPGRWYSLAEKKDDFQQVGFHGWNLTEALSAWQSRSSSRKRVLNKQRNGRRKALKKKRWKLKWKKRKRRLKRKRRCAIEIGSTSDWCCLCDVASCYLCRQISVP